MPSLLDYLMNPQGWDQLQRAVQGTRIENDPRLQGNFPPPIAQQQPGMDLRSLLAQSAMDSRVQGPSVASQFFGQGQPQNAPQMPTVAPQSTQMAQATSTPSIPESVKPGANGGKFDFKKFMLELGIPLATTGIGLAVPGALPGAAGFNQGYVGELTKESDAQRRKRFESDNKVFRLVDENGDVIKEIPIKKGDYTKVKGADEDVLAGLVKEIMSNSPAIKTDQQVVNEVTDEFIPKEGEKIPDASQYEDGRFLRDENGNPVAVSKGGKWRNIR